MKRLKRIIALCLCFIVGTCGVVEAKDWSKVMKKYGFSNVEELVNYDTKSWPENSYCVDLSREDYAEDFGRIYDNCSDLSEKERLDWIVKKLWKKRKWKDGTTTNYKKAFNLALKTFKHNTKALLVQGETPYYLHQDLEYQFGNADYIEENEAKYGNFVEAFNYAYYVAYYKMMNGNYKLFNKLVDYSVITNASDTDFSDYAVDELHTIIDGSRAGEVVDLPTLFLMPYCSYLDQYEYTTTSTITGVWIYGDYARSAGTPRFLLSEGYLKNKGLLSPDWSYPVSPDCDPEHAICKTFIYCPEVDNTYAKWLPHNGCIQVNISDGAKTLRRGYFTAVGSNVDALYADYIAISYGDASFSIEDESIATVDSNGTITPLSEGETTLTIHLDANGSYGEAERTVPLVIGR